MNKIFCDNSDDDVMIICEIFYLIYRRIKALFLWCVYLPFGLLSIKRDKIVFSAFEGGGYACNPKYIAEELIKYMQKNGKYYELVWLVNDVSKQFPAEITPIKNTLWNRAYHLSTAKVWVDNSRKNYGTRKRNGQFYMQTWHGQIGLKPVGRLRGDSFSKIAELVTRYDASLEDCFLINSEYARDIFSRSFYNEPLVKVGSPRLDILINNRERQRQIVRQMLGLPQDTKLVVYAPTFRGGSQAIKRNICQENSSLDYKKLKEVLSNRFGGNWYILIRLHPQLGLRLETSKIGLEYSGFCKDISLADDMYEYLPAVDCFITDYSSAAMDAAIARMPVFIYADDMDEYTKERGNLLYDFAEFPFPYAKTNEELQQIIKEFDEQIYLRKLEDFFIKEDVLEDGRASERAVEIIVSELSK